MTESPAPAAGSAGPEVGPEVGGRLRYRLLTGTDDRAFCEKISAALAEGYVLHGSPAVAFDGARLVTAQAVVLPAAGSGSAGQGRAGVVPA